MIKVTWLLVLGFVQLQSFSQTQLAFPGVEGYGKFTVGGRGGTVYEVTNLNDAGVGSLRAAVEAPGPRTVVFRVSGTIKLAKELKIANPNITIAGQTAPGDGICLRDYPLVIGANEVIIRYLRVRFGNETGGESDAVSCRYVKNLVLDHVSASWSVDETMSVYHCENITVQWCLISESMYNSKHAKGAHGYGGIWGSDYSTYHHNILAHHSSRNPRVASGCGNFDFRNNVIYNWGYNSTYGGEQVQVGDPQRIFSNINLVANYYKPGPATGVGVAERIANPSSRNLAADYGKWYIANNVLDGSLKVSNDNWNGGVQAQDGTAYLAGMKLAQPWQAMAIDEQNATDAYYSVLANAGATLPKRDIVDTRIIADTRSGTATYEGATYKQNKTVPDMSKICGMIDSQNDVGGWPELASAPAPADTDHDGMPDAWEDSHGHSRSNPNDGKTIGADGYTNLEKYLNSIEYAYGFTGLKLTKITGSSYKLDWIDSFASESGFKIMRSLNGGKYELLTTLPKYTTTYTDILSVAASVAYRVVVFNADNSATSETVSDGVSANENIQNTTEAVAINCFPNPFTDSFKLELKLANILQLRIELFDIQSNCIETIANRMFQVGSDSIEWHIQNASEELKPGVYLLRINSNTSDWKKEIKLIKK
jgi:pectate lyase